MGSFLSCGQFAVLCGGVMGTYFIGGVPLLFVSGIAAVAGYMLLLGQLPIENKNIIEIYDEDEQRAIWMGPDKTLRVNLAYGGSESVEDLLTLLEEKYSLIKILNEREKEIDNQDTRFITAVLNGASVELDDIEDEEITKLDVRRIRFTQYSVKMEFQNGGSLLKMAEGIEDGSIAIKDIPPIYVFKYRGETYSLDNRRLLAARIAAYNGGRTNARARILHWRMARFSLAKLTHPQHGREIKIKDAATTPPHCSDEWLQKTPNKTIKQITEKLGKTVEKRGVRVRRSGKK